MSLARLMTSFPPECNSSLVGITWSEGTGRQFRLPLTVPRNGVLNFALRDLRKRILIGPDA